MTVNVTIRLLPFGTTELRELILLAGVVQAKTPPPDPQVLPPNTIADYLITSAPPEIIPS